VPNFGPWVAAVPGVLIALSDSPTTGAWVIAVYLGVQMLESYIITPMVQQRTVDLPPAATILAQVLMGLLLGVLGLALATPLLVVVLVVVKMLYVEDAIGERMRLPGRDRAGAGKNVIC
jgi:predicted PurR-regulated permease PerM